MMARPAVWLLGKAEEAGKVLGPLPADDFAVQRHWKYPDRIVGLLGQRLGWMSPHPTVNVGWMRDISGRGAQYSRRSFCRWEKPNSMHSPSPPLRGSVCSHWLVTLAWTGLSWWQLTVRPLLACQPVWRWAGDALGSEGSLGAGTCETRFTLHRSRFWRRESRCCHNQATRRRRLAPEGRVCGCRDSAPKAEVG